MREGEEVDHSIALVAPALFCFVKPKMSTWIIDLKQDTAVSLLIICSFPNTQLLSYLAMENDMVPGILGRIQPFQMTVFQVHVCIVHV